MVPPEFVAWISLSKMYDVVEKDTGNVIVFKATEYPHCKSIQNIQWGKAFCPTDTRMTVNNVVCYWGYVTVTLPISFSETTFCTTVSCAELEAYTFNATAYFNNLNTWQASISRDQTGGGRVNWIAIGI